MVSVLIPIFRYVFYYRIESVGPLYYKTFNTVQQMNSFIRGNPWLFPADIKQIRTPLSMVEDTSKSHS